MGKELHSQIRLRLAALASV